MNRSTIVRILRKDWSEVSESNTLIICHDGKNQLMVYRGGMIACGTTERSEMIEGSIERNGIPTPNFVANLMAMLI